MIPLELGSKHQGFTCESTKFILAYLESPFAANPKLGMTEQDNIAYARQCMHFCLLAGIAPFASHLLYTQPGVLDDTIPAERSLGMNAGFAWAEVAQVSIFFLDYGLSGGMQQGIYRAVLAHRPIILCCILGTRPYCYRYHYLPPQSTEEAQILTDKIAEFAITFKEIYQRAKTTLKELCL